MAPFSEQQAQQAQQCPDDAAAARSPAAEYGKRSGKSRGCLRTIAQSGEGRCETVRNTIGSGKQRAATGPLAAKVGTTARRCQEETVRGSAL